MNVYRDELNSAHQRIAALEKDLDSIRKRLDSIRKRGFICDRCKTFFLSKSRLVWTASDTLARVYVSRHLESKALEVVSSFGHHPPPEFSWQGSKIKVIYVKDGTYQLIIEEEEEPP